MNFTPDMNDGTNCFVFGSNEAGHHAGGAAAEAKRNWGAVSGVSFGFAGNSFAIPTMDEKLRPLALPKINRYVKQFISCAKLNLNKKFLVTAIGTGICGYSEQIIAPMFHDAPDNCVLPTNWRNIKP